jgi:hypothetical protein
MFIEDTLMQGRATPAGVECLSSPFRFYKHVMPPASVLKYCEDFLIFIPNLPTSLQSRLVGLPISIIRN